MGLSERIQAEIEKRFAESDRAAVRTLLAPLDSERVHLSILRLSRGQVKRVADLAEAAKRDCRDVIAWASQPTRRYIVGLMRKGPQWTDEDQRKCTHLQHDALRRWKDAGAIVVGGMFVDFDEPRGLYIFTVDSIEEAQALVQADPAVIAGKLTFEFHPWLAPDGLRIASPDES
jgi:uncharacterized protein YciI